jgi:hypothetical protein
MLISGIWIFVEKEEEEDKSFVMNDESDSTSFHNFRAFGESSSFKLNVRFSDVIDSKNSNLIFKE